MTVSDRKRSRPKPAETGAEAGFSLIEVLAALFITMLLILALTPFTGQMLATWARGTRTADLVEAMTRGVGLLRRDLRHAVVWAGPGDSASAARFRGSETSLSFLAATSLGSGRQGLQIISITIEPGADGNALVRRGASLPGAQEPVFADRVVLLSGPYSYRFRYVARKGQAVPAWNSLHELPARIELEIGGHAGPILAAPLEFPVLASLSAACISDRKLSGCPNAQPDEQDIRNWQKDFGYTGGEE